MGKEDYQGYYKFVQRNRGIEMAVKPTKKQQALIDENDRLRKELEELGKRRCHLLSEYDNATIEMAKKMEELRAVTKEMFPNF
jgi:molecular chaperone GrpE (heat shock protein)